MKKSTRFLALLLCLVMVATLMPTMALADVTYTLMDPKDTLKQEIITLSKDRYTVKTGDEINFNDTGYGYETTYMFPQGNGGTAYEFQIHRTQDGTNKEEDLNRWWRWAKDGDVLNQRQSDKESGYDKHNGTPGIDGWTAKVVYRDDGDADGRLRGDEQLVPKDGTRVQSYILMKPLLMPRPYCFIWTGGNRNRSANVIVTIDTTKDVGTSAILWSANGTDSKHFGNFLRGTEIVTNRRVHYGDLGQNYMVIVTDKYVYYDLNGGNINGSTNNPKYVCWTTTNPDNSQKHKVIAAPTREGYTFQGWRVINADSAYDQGLVGKFATPGADINKGITGNIWLQAEWRKNADVTNYEVQFNGNGATGGSMDNQAFTFQKADNLDANQYVQSFKVTYNAASGECAEAYAMADSTFIGWEDRGSLMGYDYTQFDPKYYADANHDVHYILCQADPDTTYPAWSNDPGLYNAYVDKLAYDKVALLGHYINNGQSEGRAPVDPSGARHYYKDQELVNNLTNVKGDVVPLYAMWQPGSVVLPAAQREPTSTEIINNKISGWIFDGWYTSDGTYAGMDGAVYTPGKDVTLLAKWTPRYANEFYIYHSATGRIDTVSLDEFVNMADYKVKNEETDNYETASFITGYKKTFDITAEVDPEYLYGGTFETESFEDVAEFDGKYNSLSTMWIPIIGTVVTGAEEKTESSNDPTKMYPQAGKTYYIHEVSKQHLVPSTLSVWEKTDGKPNITSVYLLTAVDRQYYSEVGFTVNDGFNVKSVDDNGKTIYDKLGIKTTEQSTPTLFLSYYNLTRADTTQYSKLYCCELSGFENGKDVIVVPYWVTLDGMKVTGPAQRVFSYQGEGYKELKVADTAINSTVTKATPAEQPNKAPLKMMARYSMGQEANPVVIQTPDIITVIDGANNYTVETYDNSIKGKIVPAGADGQLFSGWFADEALTAAADLENVSDGDSVYAKYVSDKYLQVKYASVFTLLNKTISLTSAVDSKDYAETGFVIETKNGTDTVVVNSYATKFALQNAGQLFGVAKNAPLMTVDYKLNGLSRNDKVTITPYWVTADGTTVYGTARTLTFNGLVMKG